MDSSTRTKSNTLTRLCFIDEDDGLASIAATKTSFSRDNNKPLISIPINFNGFQKKSSSLRNLASSEIANGRFFHEEQHEQPPTHFLDSCFLCKKTLGHRDIFMYRGDTPFCSEECRQEQIEMDEAKEKSWKSTKAFRKMEQTTSTSPNKTTQAYQFSTSPVAAA
ncbi:hypothetical protein LIER_07417 [Lithospermum erythrorhizon]|uniref:FLZ-type domain-containing protein n=1 Tax=Lithospermum erythrorhizon TaxID=34254 RepID=A0AAV3P883_LITER